MLNIKCLKFSVPMENSGRLRQLVGKVRAFYRLHSYSFKQRYALHRCRRFSLILILIMIIVYIQNPYEAISCWQ